LENLISVSTKPAAGHISEAKFRQSLRFFCADLTASQATDLSGLDRKTALRLFTLSRAV
jgi:hypothetical protein